MDPLPLDKVKFDAKAVELEALTRDWADRECTSFDEAVRRAAGLPKGNGGSIWDMPAIDSKRVVSLLVELEQMLGCNLPSALIKRGGYRDTDALVANLLPKIRHNCPDVVTPAAISADAAAIATSAPSLSR